MQGKSISLSVLPLNQEKTDVGNVADLVLLRKGPPTQPGFWRARERRSGCSPGGNTEQAGHGSESGAPALTG